MTKLEAAQPQSIFFSAGWKAYRMQTPQPVSDRFPRGAASIDNPYPTGSPAAKAWDDGFRKAFEVASPRVKKSVVKHPAHKKFSPPTNNPRFVRSEAQRAR